MKIPIVSLVMSIMLISSCTTRTTTEDSMVTVSLMGEFMEPGDYRITEKYGLIEAIVLAGGFTDFANKHKVSVHRDGLVWTYDVKAILKHEQADPLIEGKSTIRAWGTDGLFSSELLEPMKEYLAKSNQQVDPIVPTPVDKVEAQSTQGHP